MRYFALWFAVSISCALPNVCFGNLLIKLREVGTNRVQVSWEGSGTILGPTTVGTINNLDFVDFLGSSPFGSSIGTGPNGDGNTFALSSATPTPLTLTISPGTIGEFSQTYDEIRLKRQPLTSDFSLIGIGTLLPVGQPYEASGAALVELEQGGSGEPLAFTDLNMGTYFTNTTFDAGVFGGVTLEIVPVPEASAWLFGVVASCILGLKRAYSSNI